MIKFRDILRNTILWNRISIIIDESQNSWLRDLGKNDYYHSITVEKILDRLVPDNLKQNEDIFDQGEIFLILVAIYLHDIGRKKSSMHHEIESYDVIRKNYKQFYLSNEFEAEAVAQICAAHASEKVWPISKCDKNFGIAALSATGKTFNLQRLGVLLRIADELDNTYVRVNGLSSEKQSVRNLIRDINPLPNRGVIEIQAQPKTWEDYEKVIKVSEYAQKRLREISNYLQDIGLDYYQVWPAPINFKAPLVMDDSVKNYPDLIESVAVLAESNFTSVEILSKIEDCEIQVLCKQSGFGGVETITAILVTKELNESRSLEFKGALTYLRRNFLIHNGIIVTNDEVAPNVKDDLISNNFYVFTFNELLNDFIDFKPVLEKYIQFYKQEDIYKKNLYVDVNLALETGQLIEPINKYINSWIDNPYEQQITILGEYGSGKTTFCEKLSYDLSIDYIKDPVKKRIPLLFKLKDIGSMNSIESAVTDYLVNKQKLEINYRTFECLNKNGKFLIILDGFDEMPWPANKNNVIKAFKEIDKLVEQKSKIILTCRTHFFKSTQDVHNLYRGSVLYDSIKNKYGYNLLFVQPFTKIQIYEYIDKWKKWDNKDYNYKKRINDIYNLSDLATRPVLLNIIAKTVPQLNLTNESEINSSSLYRMYINFWLERDDWRSKLNSEDRKALAETVSEYVFLNQLPTIHYSKIKLILNDSNFDSQKYDMEELDYEMRTCNFLKNDHFGNYSFVHKSFMEYLLAEILFINLFDIETTITKFWFLPLENIKEQNKIIAPAEVEFFFLQLFSIKLNTLSIQHIVTLSDNNDDRRKNIIARSIMTLNNYDYGEYYARLINNPNCKIDNNFLIVMILKSNDLLRTFSILLELLTENEDLSHINKIYDLLKLHVHRSKNLTSYMEKILEIIKEKEKKYDDNDEDENNIENDYPFTRTKRRQMLDKILKELSDPDEIFEEKKRFMRNWKRNKSEYDQKVRRQKKIEKRI